MNTYDFKKVFAEEGRYLGFCSDIDTTRTDKETTDKITAIANFSKKKTLSK